MSEVKIHKKRESYLYSGFKPEGAPDFYEVEYVLKSDYDALKAKLEEHSKFFREILFTEEGEKIVGVSRNGAIKAYNRNIYVARKLLYGQPYPENT